MECSITCCWLAPKHPNWSFWFHFVLYSLFSTRQLNQSWKCKSILPFSIIGLQSSQHTGKYSQVLALASLSLRDWVPGLPHILCSLSFRVLQPHWSCSTVYMSSIFPFSAFVRVIPSSGIFFPQIGTDCSLHSALCSLEQPSLTTWAKAANQFPACASVPLHLLIVCINHVVSN